MGMRARIESRMDAEKKGKRTVLEDGGCSIMLWLREDRVLVVPDTDGVRRARGNRELACVVWASWAQCLGHNVHSDFSKHSLLPEANFSLFLFFSFPSLTTICANLLIELRS